MFVQNPQVLVIGAAAVDITAHPATDLSIHSTTPGSVLVSLGGLFFSSSLFLLLVTRH
jgi:hypothetical protein